MTLLKSLTSAIEALPVAPNRGSHIAERFNTNYKQILMHSYYLMLGGSAIHKNNENYSIFIFVGTLQAQYFISKLN